MCGVVPTPPEPKFIAPFFALASAIRSLIEWIGELALTTATSGEMPIIARPVSSLVDVELEFLVERRRDRERGLAADHDGVAVGRRLGDLLGGDQSAGAGPVLDHEALAGRLGELLRDHARRDVGAAAGREADHDLDRMIGIFRRLGLARGRAPGSSSAAPCRMRHAATRGSKPWCSSLRGRRLGAARSRSRIAQNRGPRPANCAGFPAAFRPAGTPR